MMTDIVERLRVFDTSSADTLREAFGAMLEAADEIERLRAALAERHEGGTAMTDLRKAAEALLSAVDLALPYAPHRHEFDRVADTADDLRAALAAEQAPDAEALRAEVEALRRDAERYRWLRDQAVQEVQFDHDAREATICVCIPCDWDDEPPLDEAIDAVMTRAQKGE